MCLSYAVHSKEVTQSPILSSPLKTREAALECPRFPPYLLCLCALEPQLSDRYQDACFFLLCIRDTGRENTVRSILLMLRGTVLWEYVLGVFVCLMSFYDDDDM